VVGGSCGQDGNGTGPGGWMGAVVGAGRVAVITGLIGLDYPS
jgi:hypothetical protein